MKPALRNDAWLNERLGLSGGRARMSPLRLLAMHAAAVSLTALLFANVMWMIPFLARREFGAGNLQTVLVTAAVPVFLLFSVLWNELLGRVSLWRYVSAQWLMAVFPLICMALAQNYWQLLACYVISAVGQAGWIPLYGKLLKSFYSDAVRGRVYAILTVVQLASGMITAYFVAEWLKLDANAFRVFLPLAGISAASGLAILLFLARRTGADRLAIGPTGHPLGALREAMLGLVGVFRQDPLFFRYELAFMTYGGAFMFCDALLPVLAEGKLGLSPDEYGHATRVALSAAMLLVVYPMGWINDRVGATRVCAFSFGLLTLYPLLLAAATGPDMIAIASVIFGIAMAGVSVGWMLGPVAFAPRPEKVPQYVAIHATMVGVRGLVFQFLGMGLLAGTGSFTVPFVIAALAFVAAALQMWSLHGSIRTSRSQITGQGR